MYFCLMMLKKGLIIICLILTFLKGNSETYFIKSNGNDNLNGLSITNAWQSINKVNSFAFKPNDTVLFEGGSTFLGSVYLQSFINGTKGKSIVIGSYGNSKATISSSNNSGFYAYNNECITVQDLIFVGSGYTNNTTIGVCFYLDSTNNKIKKNISIKNIEVSGYNKSGISILSWTSDNSRSGYQNIEILNCKVFENGLSGISISGEININDSLYSHKKVLIRNCKVYNNHGVIGYNSHSGSGIVVGQVDSCLIEYCEAYENGKNNTFASAGPVGIWAWDSKNVIIQHCYSHHNRTQTKDGGGFDLDGGVRNSIMQYNYSFDNDGPGLLVAQYTGARPMKNICVRYNISEKDGNGLGALIWSGDPANSATAEKIDFYNNTFYVDTIKDINTNCAIGVYNNYGAIKNVRIANNLFLTKNGVNFVDLNPTVNLRFYNNVYFSFGGLSRFKDQNSTYNLLSSWRNATQQERYNNKNVGFQKNPDLINPGNYGSLTSIDSLKYILAYRYKNNSSLINTGLVIDSLLYFNDLKHDFFFDAINFKKQFSPGSNEIQQVKSKFTVQNTCQGAPLNILNQSENALSYQWKINDINQSSAQTPQIIADTFRYLNVKLIVKGQWGYVDSSSYLVLTNKKPIPNFSFINNCINDTVLFRNQSQFFNHSIWKIENQSLITQNDFKCKFDSLGTYNVKLTVSNTNKSCIDSIEKKVTIFKNPFVKFNLNNGCSDDSILVFNQQLFAKKEWSLNDSLISISDSVFLLSSSSGSFQVKLKVSDSNLCQNSEIQNLIIYPKTELKIQVSNHCLGHILPIYNTPNERGESKWSFGDLSFSDSLNPKHYFQDAAHYFVQFEFKNQWHCKSKFEDTVFVYPKSNASFTIIKNNSFLNFIAKDTQLYRYQWKIDDIIYSNNNQFKLLNINEKDIKKKVSLTAFNFNNCSDSSVYFITKDSITNLKFYKNWETRIAPNPFDSKIKISSNIDNYSIQIFNQIGILMFQKQDVLNEIEIYSDDVFFQKGIYFVVIQKDKFLRTFKVLKN